MQSPLPWPAKARIQLGVKACSTLANSLSMLGGTPVVQAAGSTIMKLQRRAPHESVFSTQESILCHAVSPDSQLLVVCYRARLDAYRCTDALAEAATTFKLHHIPKSVAVTLLREALYAIAVGGADGVLLRYVNLADRAEVVSGEACATQIHENYPMCCVSYSPSGSLLAVACSDSKIALWDARQLAAPQEVRAPVWFSSLPEHVQRATSIAIHQSDSFLAIGCWDGSCCLYTLESSDQCDWVLSGEPLIPSSQAAVFDHTQPGAYVVWHPHPTPLLAVASSSPPQLNIYSVTEGCARVLARWKPPADESSVASAIKGAVASEKLIWVFHRNTLLTTLEWPRRSCTGLHVTCDIVLSSPLTHCSQASKLLWQSSFEGEYLAAEAADDNSLDLVLQRAAQDVVRVPLRFLPVAEVELLEASFRDNTIVAWLPRVVYVCNLEDPVSQSKWGGWVVQGSTVQFACIGRRNTDVLILNRESELKVMSTTDSAVAEEGWGESLLPLERTIHWSASCSDDTRELLLVWQVWALP